LRGARADDLPINRASGSAWQECALRRWEQATGERGMAAVELAPLQETDCEEVAELWTDIFRDYPLAPEVLRQQTFEYPDFDPGGAWTARVAGSVVGFAFATARRRHETGSADIPGCIEAIMVHPAHRRRGIGTALLERGMAFLCSQGRRTVKAGRRGERLREDQAAFRPLPAVPFDACRKISTTVSSLSLVCFDRNQYSVPVRCAHQPVVVKGYTDRVEVWQQTERIAVHRRRWGKDGVSFDPVHYLALLERKAGGAGPRPAAGGLGPAAVLRRPPPPAGGRGDTGGRRGPRVHPRTAAAGDARTRRRGPGGQEGPSRECADARRGRPVPHSPGGLAANHLPARRPGAPPPRPRRPD